MGQTPNDLDLHLGYFSGLNIICIPHTSSKPSHTLNQYKALSAEIRQAATNSLVSRAEAGPKAYHVLENMNLYVKSAYDHFWSSSPEPFDVSMVLSQGSNRAVPLPLLESNTTNDTILSRLASQNTLLKDRPKRRNVEKGIRNRESDSETFKSKAVHGCDGETREDRTSYVVLETSVPSGTKSPLIPKDGAAMPDEKPLRSDLMGLKRIASLFYFRLNITQNISTQSEKLFLCQGLYSSLQLS